MSLLDLASQIVDRASGSEGIEAFVTHEREFSVKAYEGEVENLSSAEPRGAGIRIVRDGRVGFAYTTDLTDEGIGVAVDLARSNSEHSTADDSVGLADAWTERSGSGRGTARRSPTITYRAGEGRLRSGARGRHVANSIRGSVPLRRRCTRTPIPRSRSQRRTGSSGIYRRTDAWCYSVAIAEEDDDTQIGFEFDLARGSRRIGSRDASRARPWSAAVGILGASKIPSKRMPVVFEPYVAGQFLGVSARRSPAKPCRRAARCSPTSSRPRWRRRH